jgi:Ca2+/Na+ antiporter
VTGDLIYAEKLSSNRTEALFLALTLLFLWLLLWRVSTGGLDILAAAFVCLFVVFLFYTVNYRQLAIRLTSESVKVTFGVFTWTVPLDNIEEAGLDELPWLLKWGGAGIHFMFVRGRYRVSFNFLEHARVVIAFKRKQGPVRDLSFSTRRPEHILRLIQEAVAAQTALPDAAGRT